MTFISELKRRRVVRVVVVYGAVAFAIIQAADIITPALHLPAWFMTAVVVLAALGLPVALVLAWAFDLTPEGIRKTDVGDPATSSTSSSWLPARVIVMAAVLIGLGVGAGWLLKPGSAASGDAAKDAAPSLAVLPFDNVSGETAHAAFAIGLHDDLLTQLSRIGRLRLVSRTSVREYAGTTKNVRDIARELGVRTILEGSVQRDAQQIRINVQLIDGNTDEHLWAETYDKDLTVENLFAIQAEIASAIASALQAELTGEARAEIAQAPTSNMDAYEAYLRGLSRGYWDSQAIAAEAFEQAARLDPDFVDAWAAAARARTWLARLGFDYGDLKRGRKDAAAARSALAHAVELAPNGIATKFAQGYAAYYIDWDLQRALRLFNEIRAAQPASSAVLIAIGQVQRRLAEWDEATASFQRALVLDQRNEDAAQELGQTQYYSSRVPEALRSARVAVQLRPNCGDCLALFLPIYIGLGDTIAARRFVQEHTLPFDASSFIAPDQLQFVTLDRPAMERRLGEVLENSAHQPPGMVYWAAVRWAHRLGDHNRQRAFADSSRAIGELQLRAVDRSIDPRTHASLLAQVAIGHAYAGNSDAALRAARKALDLVPYELDAIEVWQFREMMFEVLIVTGRHDEAVAFARELIRPPSPWSVGRLATDPLTQPLRNHPGFRRLISGSS